MVAELCIVFNSHVLCFFNQTSQCLNSMDSSMRMVANSPSSLFSIINLHHIRLLLHAVGN